MTASQPPATTTASTSTVRLTSSTRPARRAVPSGDAEHAQRRHVAAVVTQVPGHARTQREQGDERAGERREGVRHGLGAAVALAERVAHRVERERHVAPVGLGHLVEHLVAGCRRRPRPAPPPTGTVGPEPAAEVRMSASTPTAPSSGSGRRRRRPRWQRSSPPRSSATGLVLVGDQDRDRRVARSWSSAERDAGQQGHLEPVGAVDHEGRGRLVVAEEVAVERGLDRARVGEPGLGEQVGDCRASSVSRRTSNSTAVDQAAAVARDVEAGDRAPVGALRARGPSGAPGSRRPGPRAAATVAPDWLAEVT